MKKNKLTPDSEFVVGEERLLNFIIALLFFGLFLYGLIDAVNRDFKNIDYQSYVLCLALIPVVYCVRKARSRRIYIRINKTGIYQDEKLVTAWTGFIKATLAQKEKTKIINLQDNFLLLVDFKKEGKILRRSIPLTNTQDKSEEDVLEAVRFFWRLQPQKEGGVFIA